MHSHLNLVSSNVFWPRILLRCILKLLLPGKSRTNAVLLIPIRYNIQLNPVSSVFPSSSETGFQIKKSVFPNCSQGYPARMRSARARRACALRALGLLLADGAPTVGGGKTF